MEMKTLVTMVIVMLSFAILALVIFYFRASVSGSGLNNITSWGWI